MRKIKRLVGIALTLCMILSTVPCTSLAVETPEERNDLKGFCGAEGGNLAWEIDPEEGTLTISGTGKMADFEANEEEETSTAPWFAYAKDPPNRKDRDLEKIIVKEGVTSVSNYAFAYCDDVSEIVLADTVTQIGSGAFMSTDLEDTVYIPPNVTSIGDAAFADCDWLDEVFFYGDAPAFVGADLFKGNYVDICCVDGTTGWTDSAAFNEQDRDWNGYGLVVSGFCGAEGDNVTWRYDLMNSLVISGEGKMADYAEACTEDGDFCTTAPWFDYGTLRPLYAVDIEIEDGVTYVGDWAFADFLADDIVIADSVTEIGEFAFDNNYAVSIELAEGLTKIGESAFNIADISELQIPSSVTYIGDYAFASCNYLTDVYFYGDAPAEFGEDVFLYPADDMTIYYLKGTSGWTDSEDYDARQKTWNGYPLAAWKSVDNNDSPPLSGSCGSDGDNLTWEIDPNSGTLTIKGSGRMADYEAVCTSKGGNYCTAPWFAYSDKNATINAGANRSLEKVIIEDGVTYIGEDAFAFCEDLFEADISDTVTEIGEEAFNFTGIFGGGLNWLVLPSALTFIGDNAFSSNNFRRIYIPEKVTTIGQRAFADCEYLKAVYFCGDAPTTFGKNVFRGQEDKITLYYMSGTHGWTDSEDYDAETQTWNGYKLDVWGDVQLSGICGLEGDNLHWVIDSQNGTLTISGNGKMADYNASWTFAGETFCSAPWFEYVELIQLLQAEEVDTTLQPITKAIIEDGVTSIGKNAFVFCDRLTDVEIADTVKEIGELAFWGFRRQSLSEITLPKELISIGNSAFCENFDLTEIYIPQNVESISNYAFSNCPFLKSVYFYGDAPTTFERDVFTPSGEYADAPKTDVTLYYVKGTSGWTDSAAYNAETGTWNGYKLATWDGGHQDLPPELKGAMLSGQVTGYDPRKETSIRLMANGETAYETKIAAGSGTGEVTQTFTFADVATGVYDLVVSKDGHLDYTVKGIVMMGQNEDLTQRNRPYANIRLCAGDVNGDGAINSGDLNTVWSVDNYFKSVDAPGVNSAADVNGDGTINSDDLNIIWKAENYLRIEADCSFDY